MKMWLLKRGWGYKHLLPWINVCAKGEIEMKIFDLRKYCLSKSWISQSNYSTDPCCWSLVFKSGWVGINQLLFLSLCWWYTCTSQIVSFITSRFMHVGHFPNSERHTGDLLVHRRLTCRIKNVRWNLIEKTKPVHSFQSVHPFKQNEK